MSKEVDDLTSDYASGSSGAGTGAHTAAKQKKRLNLRSRVNQNEVKELKLTDIMTQEQPRKMFDEAKLQELADSIKDRGQLEPIRVIQEGRKYRLIFGERRFRASKLIPGKKTIQAVVYQEATTDKDIILDQLAENVHREDLHPIEKAQGLKKLLGLPVLESTTHAQLAVMVQKSETYVSRLLALSELSGEYQDMLLLHGEVFSNSFLYDTLPKLVRANRGQMDKLYTLIYDSIEAQENLLQPSAPAAKRNAVITRQKPGRKKQDGSYDGQSLKGKLSLSLKRSALKKLSTAEQVTAVRGDYDAMCQQLKYQLQERLKGVLDEGVIDDALNN